jgi:hypothetical protein
VTKFGVPVAFQGEPNFVSGPPIKGPFLDREMHSIHSEGAKEVFREVGGEGTPFLQEVEELDKKTAIFFSLGTRGSTSRPLLTFGAAEFKARNQPCGGICLVGGVPSAGNSGTEAGMENPGRFKSKETPLRDRGGNLGHEGHVVGGVTRDRGHGGGGKANIPGLVNENPIEADKSGSGPHVRSSVLAVAKGKLEEPKGINRVVKKLRFRGRKVGVILI